jgi:hypothetical protein
MARMAAPFVGAEIVENDHVSRMEGGNERLLDISREASAVDRAVEHQRRFDAIAPQSRDEGERLPMSVRRLGDQALAFRPPTAQRRHVGLDPRLVDEHQTLGVDAGLTRLPARPPTRHVRAILLAGEQAFF